MQRILVLIAAAGFTSLISEAAHGSLSIHFDSPIYTVAPGGTVRVQVLYDADITTAGDQPITGGLFSEGFSLTPQNGLYTSGPEAVVLPSVMTQSSSTQVPAVWWQQSSVSIQANEGSGATSGYDEALLATVTISDNFPSGSYSLTLGPSEANVTNFLDFPTRSGQDAGISWGTATVTVTPEPAGLGLLACGLAAMLPRRPRPR